MSVFAPSMASNWQPHRLGSRSAGLGNSSEEMGLGLGFARIQTSTLERPPLKSHKSFPHSLTSSYTTQDDSNSIGQTRNPAGQEEIESSFSNDRKPAGPLSQPPVETTYGGSAPVSPIAQASPTSAEAEQDERRDEEDDLIGVVEEDDDEPSEKSENASTEKTAEQRRAEKRKMKRFRLTHNQTRFLMSEFARQAHPDAAQRERLAKEIPGLSPRQVQVWFQNRRAKLKRLTTDDRERMMKSRALPDDFDMTQALHSSFATGGQQTFSQGYTPPLQSPATYPSAFNDHGMIRPPLMVTGLRRTSEDESTISPISMSSNFNNFYTPPGSITASESLSPTSPVAERNPFMSNWQQTPGSRSTNPYSRPGSISTPFNPHVPRLHLAHDRLTRTRAESLGSPLRTSMSYTGNLDFASSNSEETVPASNNSGIQPARSFSTDASAMSKTTGFSYLPHGFQSSALSRPRSNFPPGLDLRPSYHSSLFPFSKLAQQNESQSQSPSAPGPNHINSQAHGLRDAQATSTQHTQAPQSPHHSLAYSSAPLAPPQDFQLPNSQDLYGVQYQNSGNEVHGYGVGTNSAPSTATITEHPIEPESYYKSEPERRIAAPHHLAHPPQQASPQYQPTISSQSSQLLHPPQQQHQYPSLPSTSQLAGVKRRRGEEEHGAFVERGPAGSEMSGLPRRRSFTLPTGYGSGQSG